MKILLLTWNYPPVIGGMELLAARVAEGLRRRGHTVEVLAPAGPPEPHVYRASRPGLRAFLGHAVSRGFQRCRILRPDVLLCGSVTGAPAARILSGLFHVPCVILAHGSDVLHDAWWYRPAMRHLLRRADGVTANSRFTKGLLEKIGIDPARIAVVHPGADIPPAAPPPAAAERPAPVLLSVGRLVRRKGLLEFVSEAMPELIRRFPGLVLKIVGEEPGESLIHRERGLRARMEEAARERNIEPNVRFLGRVGDRELQALYREADLLVMPGLDLPHDAEGFGMVLIEAALAGVPSVAARTGGMPDAVADGETGCLVPPGDAAAMIEVLSGLLGDRERLRRMGLAAAGRARAEFSWEVIAARHEAVLAAVAERGRSRYSRSRIG